MDAPIHPQPRSVWADLDALVLEEVNALCCGPDRPESPPPSFASDEDFTARVAAYLGGHGDAEKLIERLCAQLGLFRRPDEAPAPPGAAEEEAGAAPDETGPAVPPPASGAIET